MVDFHSSATTDYTSNATFRSPNTNESPHFLNLDTNACILRLHQFQPPPVVPLPGRKITGRESRTPAWVTRRILHRKIRTPQWDIPPCRISTTNRRHRCTLLLHHHHLHAIHRHHILIHILHRHIHTRIPIPSPTTTTTTTSSSSSPSPPSSTIPTAAPPRLGSMMMMSMIMWLFFGASIPDFEVASISVSNFTATNTSLSGSWSVGMWVSNVNMKVDVDFHHGMSSIFYKNSLLGIAAMEPFLVRKMQRFGLNFTVPAMRMQDDQKLQSWVLPALAEDRSDGAVAFSLGMAVDANFTAPDADYRKESLRILCEDLEIRFPSPTSGEGTWSQGLGSPCYIRLHESHD